MAAHSITTIFYLMEKNFGREAACIARVSWVSSPGVAPKSSTLNLLGTDKLTHKHRLGNIDLCAMLEQIREKILRRQYEFSKHAVDQSIIRDISTAEMEQAISARTEIIEDYPDDKYGPSCLILGFTTAGRALHFQCSYPNRPIIKIITLYEPDPTQWIDFKTRKTD